MNFTRGRLRRQRGILLEAILGAGFLASLAGGFAVYSEDLKKREAREAIARDLADQHIDFARALRAELQANPFFAQSNAGAVSVATLVGAGRLAHLSENDTARSIWETSLTAISVRGQVEYTNGLPTAAAVLETAAPNAARWQRLTRGSRGAEIQLRRSAARRIASRGPFSVLEMRGGVLVDAISGTPVPPATAQAYLGGTTPPEGAFVTIVQPRAPVGFWLVRVSANFNRWNENFTSTFLRTVRTFRSSIPLATAGINFIGYTPACPPGALQPNTGNPGTLRLHSLQPGIRSPTTANPNWWSASAPSGVSMDMTLCLPATPPVIRSLTTIRPEWLGRITDPDGIIGNTCSANPLWGWGHIWNFHIGTARYGFAFGALETPRALTAEGAVHSVAMLWSAPAPASNQVNLVMPDPNTGADCTLALRIYDYLGTGNDPYVMR